MGSRRVRGGDVPHVVRERDDPALRRAAFVEGAAIDPLYGSRVSSSSMGGCTYDVSNGVTPFITCALPSGWTLQSSGFGDLINVARFGGAGDPTFSLGGPGGFEPIVYGIDLATFPAGEPYANCDGSTGSPSLTVADFACFLARFRAGCP